MQKKNPSSYKDTAILYYTWKFFIYLKLFCNGFFPLWSEGKEKHLGLNLNISWWSDTY